MVGLIFFAAVGIYILYVLGKKREKVELKNSIRDSKMTKIIIQEILKSGYIDILVYRTYVYFNTNTKIYYADYGYDIVCASISTACIVTANLIEKLNLSYNIIDLVCDEGYFRLSVKTIDETLNGIFENLEYTMEDISKQYPKYLKIVK